MCECKLLMQVQLLSRDVRNRFFYFTSVSVRFLTKLGCGSELVWFGLINAVSFRYYSHLLLT